MNHNDANPKANKSISFQALLDALSDGIILGTANGTITGCNQAACEIYGYTRDELTRLNLEDLATEISPLKIPDDISIETNGKRKDGKIFRLELSTSRITHEGKKKIIAQIRDISNRIAADTALLEEQRARSTLMSNLPGMAYRCRNNPSYTMEFVSDGCRSLTGYAPQDLIHDQKIPYGELIHPDDRPMVWENIQDAVQKDEPFQVIYRLMPASGEAKWVWEQGRTVYDTEGTLLALEGIILDVTTQVKAQEKNRLLATALAATDIGIVITDDKNTITWVNPAFTTLTGHEDIDILGKSMAMLYSGKHAQALYDEIWATINARQVWHGEYINYRKDGTPYHEETTITPVYAANGQITHFISTKQDISERIREQTQRQHYQDRGKKQLNALVELGTAPTLNRTNLDTTLHRIVEITAKVLDVPRASIWELKENNEKVHCLAIYEAEERSPGTPEKTTTGDYCYNYHILLRDKLVIAIDDVKKDPRTAHISKAYWDAQGTTAILSTRLHMQGRTVGILCCEHNDALRKWQSDEINFASRVADLIVRTFLDAELRRQAKELTTITRVSRDITSMTDLQEVLASIAQHATTLLDTDACAVFALGPGEQLIMAGHGLNHAIDKHVEELKLLLQTDQGANKVLHTPKSLKVSDLQQLSNNTYQKLADSEGIRAVLVVPMHHKGKFIGGIILGNHQTRDFNDQETAFIEALAQQSINAIENARLFKAEQEKRELAEALEEAAAFVSSNLDLDEVLDRILEQVARVVNGDTFNIMLRKGNKVQIVRWRGYGAREINEELPVREFSLDKYLSLIKMTEEAKPILITDTRADPNWVPSQEDTWRRAYIGAPINVGEQTIGFLNVNSCQPNHFNHEDAHRLKIFADHIAAAIENARLYQAQREYTEKLEVRVYERTAELQKQYARLEAVLRSTSDGIIVTNAQGEIIQTNPVVESWFNRSLSPEDAETLRQTVHDISQQADEHPEIILELQGLDLQLNAAPITSSNTQEASVVVAVHDVSHLKALERMQSQFVSDVSHELRTPLTTAKLYTQLLRRSSQEKHAAYLDALEAELERQSILIEDILDLSRIDAGRLALTPRPTDLNKLSASILMGHDVLAQSKKLHLESNLTTPAPITFIDAVKMDQVLSNLIENAIRYTPPEGIIQITTKKAQAKERQWAIFQIQDTGIGIPAEELPYIFSRFFRGAQPREEQIQGTGLGLAIAKEIVELHGGWIDVRSEVKTGTTFTVWLPLADTDLS